MSRSILSLLVLSLLSACGAGPSRAAAVRTTPLVVPATVAYQEGSFTGTGGLKLYEASWRPPTGEPRAAVVLLHGLKDHADRYAEVATALVGSGYAVHAFDLRGHALSEGERAFVERFDDYVADLGLFVQRVQAEHPGKPLFLFGHSMGGAISTLYALENQSRLGGLILSAAALKPGKDVNAVLVALSGVASALTPRAKLLEGEETKFSRDPQVVAQMKSDPLILQGNGPARTGAELLKAMDRIGQRAGELSLPVLALHGTADQLTNPEGSAELIAKAVSTDKTLTTYEGLVHDLVHEPERAKVIADLIAWLDTRAPKP